MMLIARNLALLLLITTGQMLPAELHEASALGRFVKVKQLLKRGVNPSQQDEIGNSPLHFVKSTTMAQLLVDNKANVNAKNNYGLTPLHVAVVRGKWRLVQKLLSMGAKVNVTDDNGITPLHLATAISYLKDKSALISPLDPSVMGVKDAVGATISTVAGVIASSSVGAALLAKKVAASKKAVGRIHKQVMDRATRVMSTSEFTQITGVLKGYLPRRHTFGAEGTGELSPLFTDVPFAKTRKLPPNLARYSGGTPAKIAAAATVQPEVVRAGWGTLKTAATVTGIVVGLLAGAVIVIALVDIATRNKVLSLLLDAGARVNAQDILGNTPLHILADGKLLGFGNRRGGWLMARRLIKHGADALIRNDDELLPYDLAKEHHRWTLYFLLRPGAAKKRQAQMAAAEA